MLASPPPPAASLPDAYVSSCHVDHILDTSCPAFKGCMPVKSVDRRIKTALDMCVASACSFREHHPSRSAPLLYFVSKSVPESTRVVLRRLADVVVEMPKLRWPAGAGPTPLPHRLYSFWKLELWRLTAYGRVLWFDADVFWTGDAQWYYDRFGAAPHLAAAEYRHAKLVPKFWRKAGLRYINSGIMLLRPSKETYASLVHRWTTRNYTSMPARRADYRSAQLAAGRSKTSEQDIVRAHFEDTFTPMAECDNFRGYVKPGPDGSAGGQAYCDPSKIIAWHGARFRGKGRCRSEWAEGAKLSNPPPLSKSFEQWERTWTGRNDSVSLSTV